MITAHLSELNCVRLVVDIMAVGLYTCLEDLNFAMLNIPLVNLHYSFTLKWYYDQKIVSFLPSDFESVFA